MDSPIGERALKAATQFGKLERSAFQNEAGIRDRDQDARPDRKHVRPDLVGAGETAERDSFCRERRQRGDVGRERRRGETQAHRRHEQEALDKTLPSVRGRAHRIGDQVVDCLEACGVEVIEPGDLYRRRLPGEYE